MEKLVYIYTYGCQMNVHDSEKMLGTLVSQGFQAAATPEQAELIIFNTCAIREKAEQKFYSQLGRIKHLKKNNPKVRIAVAGCIAQGSGKAVIRRAPHVDFVVGPQNLHLVSELQKSDKQLCLEENSALPDQEYPTQRSSTWQAWVAIMYGCNNFCSYCIVPYTRGREASRPSSSILAEISQLKERGFKEITLLGQNVNSYRSDLDFVGLLHEIEKTGIERIRFVTSHPRDLSPALIEALAELKSLCNNIHLPLQSGSDRILEAMNRKYSYADYLRKIDAIRSRVPEVTISTDIIVGFPGESDEDFEMTAHAISDIRFDGMFAFKFSRRKGTKAYDLEGQLPEELKNVRLNRLLAIQDDISLMRNRALEGSCQEILIEGVSDTDSTMLMGRTRSNKIVTVLNAGLSEGALLNVRIVKARHHSLHAEILS